MHAQCVHLHVLADHGSWNTYSGFCKAAAGVTIDCGRKLNGGGAVLPPAGTVGLAEAATATAATPSTPAWLPPVLRRLPPLPLAAAAAWSCGTCLSSSGCCSLLLSHQGKSNTHIHNWLAFMLLALRADGTSGHALCRSTDSSS